jgi:2-polyprenyl-3-methyl-5-hydroxy-6-metoxy-1,4-benzoquinol methylase
MAAIAQDGRADSGTAGQRVRLVADRPLAAQRGVKYAERVKAEKADPKFDAYAASYEELHRNNIAASGEDPAYFHEYKLDCLRRKALLKGRLLDFGCGIGNLTERFASPRAGLDEVHGYDPSEVSVAEAKARAPGATFHTDVASLPSGHFDVAVLSGVLHHVVPEERRDVLATVRKALRPGGHIVVFEHNPLNPLTQRAVKTCEFDDDAILLWPWEARRVLRDSAFADVALDFIVFFPKPLAFLRALEPKLRRLAIGAQQMLVARRPE